MLGLYMVAIRYNPLLIFLLLGANIFFLKNLKLNSALKLCKEHLVWGASLLFYIFLSSNLYVLSIDGSNLTNILIHYIGFLCGLVTSIMVLFISKK